MLGVLLVVIGAGFVHQSGPLKGARSEDGVTVDWGPGGVLLSSAGKARWQTGEAPVYRPEYLGGSKSYLLVTDAGDGRFHLTVVERGARVRCQLEISGAVAGMPPVTPCGDTLTFADPGVLARSPIGGEADPSWLDARRQLNILNVSIVGGKLRWKQPELSIGQPLAASGLYLWTVRLTNPEAAYTGTRAAYEIEQVGSFSGKIVRSWAYPSAGGDLTAFRWSAEVKGSTCTLHRMDALPDAMVDGNTSPAELTLSRIMGAVKRRKRSPGVKSVPKH